jgi:phosphopantothenoylcysteine decarboxylase/phosphopantothenate--cysteine ligase
MLKGKKIILGITGSIAAYKSVFLLRLLLQEGAEVKVIMTPAAKDFITPLTLSTLSKNPVLTELFDEQSWSNHVMLGRWADLFVIAPLSCNTLAKMAQGICDNLLLAVYLSATCPVAVAPAMDEDMWKHSSTKENLQRLKSFGNNIIPVGNGALASGLHGEGRMAEPEQILEFIKEHFSVANELQGKKVLVTAGPTYEPIDPVRFIGNHSSGKMGIAIANELCNRGAEVTLILGPTKETVNNSSISIIKVTTALEMYEAVENRFDITDLTIMAAAVADYTPVKQATQKIKKHEAGLSLDLIKTRDILKAIGERKKSGQILVGFALETNNETEYAKEKLVKKNADLIVLNSMQDKGAGFNHDTNKVTIFSKDQVFEFETKTKQEVAKDIVDTIIRLYYA